jgi:outer membrane protein assembly factor BamB
VPVRESLERVATDGAVLALAAGALVALVAGVLGGRLPRLVRLSALVVAALLLAAGTALGAWAWHEKRPRDIRGTSTQEFDTVLRPPAKPPPRRRKSGPVLVESWPTYGFDAQRTHLAPNWKLRPPFVGIWDLRLRGEIEFPPAVAYNNLYLAHPRGFFALRARSGKILWKRNIKRCTAASPTVADGIVYQVYMQPKCDRRPSGTRGFLIAFDAKTGRILWRFDAGAIESAPLLVGRTLYFGSYDRRLYALRLRGRKRPRVRWTFEAEDRIMAAPAHLDGRIYVVTANGVAYALNAVTGRRLWRATSFARFGRREYFYATPAVGYGRVFAPNTDGTVYAFGARTGKLLWARSVGTYAYTAPALWRRKVYVGTWDGNFTALDAATGEVRWRFDAPSAITGAPTVLSGLVYFSTCARCGLGGQRRVKTGRKGTFALDARNGQLVWSFFDGKYSPLVADPKRVYIIGQRTLYAMIPRARWLKIRQQRAAAKRRRGRPARPRSGAKSGTRSGRSG